MVLSNFGENIKKKKGHPRMDALIVQDPRNYLRTAAKRQQPYQAPSQVCRSNSRLEPWLSRDAKQRLPYHFRQTEPNSTIGNSLCFSGYLASKARSSARVAGLTFFRVFRFQPLFLRAAFLLVLAYFNNSKNLIFESNKRGVNSAPQNSPRMITLGLYSFLGVRRILLTRLVR